MRTPLSALVVALACIATVPAEATSAVRTLTVRGAGNTFTDVTFTARVRLSTAASSKTPPEYTTDASYAGVFVAPLGRPGPGAGTVLLRGMPVLSRLAFALGPPQEWLPPGRYRVHLLGDAPATVRIRAEGLRRDLTVTTTRPSSVRGGYLDRGLAGVTTPASRTVVPFDVQPTTLTIVSSEQRSTAVYGRRDVCVRPRSDGTSPCLEGNANRGWYWSVYSIDWSIGGAAVYSPGKLPNGSFEVEFLDVSVGAVDNFYTFVLTLN